jgi:hypothetical protein
MTFIAYTRKRKNCHLPPESFPVQIQNNSLGGKSCTSFKSLKSCSDKKDSTLLFLNRLFLLSQRINGFFQFLTFLFAGNIDQPFGQHAFNTTL